jgi:uncharacterized protein YwgA
MLKNKYFLLKFFSEVKALYGRKKLQKLIYLIKYLNGPVDYKFYKHFYGPYSNFLTSDVDVLVKDDYLKENLESLDFEKEEYRYKLTKGGQEYLKLLEQMTFDEEEKTKISKWAHFLKKINSKFNAHELEIASTILYLYDSGHSLDIAVTLAEKEKKIDIANSSFRNALNLAKDIIRLRKDTFQ